MAGNKDADFTSFQELEKNFQEAAPALKPKEAIDESNRCLYCYDAPCIKACPTSIDIPTFIKKIATGNLYGSAKTIMEANPVGASCARVCPTEELCEGACVLNGPSKPIMIGMLQKHATDWAIKNKKTFFKRGQQNGCRVAIIGAGPAGLSGARELARIGYEVTIYEAKERAGGLSTYGIVSFRLPKEIPLWEAEQVEALGVTFKYSTTVGKDISFNEIIKGYDAVLLAVGISAVKKLNIPGEELSGVLDAISFIEETKKNGLTNEFIGKNVAVIGAGNTAIDAATCAKRLGADCVQIFYRRTEKEMTAYEFEYEFAKQDGIEFRWLSSPTKIIGKNGSVTALELIKMKLEEQGQNDRPKPVPIEGSSYPVEVDYVIKAISQTRFTSIIDALNLEHENGVVLVNNKTMQTSNPKVFAAGDVIFGGGQTEAMVVDAAEQGKVAAYKIHENFTQHAGE
ncbi:NAD(P)-dependent oxidoreductase [Bacillus taeanensis]|uniref:dihydrouracil dehydrogenase (NAD(+)) n=1 Tax=Bacillus taeanensis TaxID=273032 RepID=A0A366Y485_9BACI|nr:NAD(P)-dependent oxidoreductase [Bacillus taeanensis]RBW71001.1 dihydropyrimidine dehydrogenase [Bacillus taeanensis]